MKTCFKCQETKPLDGFYAHPMMADGHHVDHHYSAEIAP